MRRIIAVLFIAAVTISACGTSPSIWGVPATPTPDSPLPATPLIDPFVVQDAPIIFPTSTIPPFIETEAAQTPPPPATDVTIEPTLDIPTLDSAPFLYYAQSGDMLSAIAKRFGVDEAEIVSDADLTRTTLIDPGILLVIPNRINEPTTPNIQLVPDSEIVFSATALDFDTEAYVKEQNGYLSSFRDYLGSTGWIAGYDAIDRLAIENSINPRLLLALLEFESRWVRGQPVDLLHTEFPMGFNDYHYKGMSVQMVWAINNMAIAYYGWRAGTITHLEFPDGSKLRLDPRLNAGTVAIQYLFSRLHSQSQWAQIINPDSGFPALFEEMFGDPWARAELVEPLFPPSLNQPPLVLPFEPGVKWSFTGDLTTAGDRSIPIFTGGRTASSPPLTLRPPRKKAAASPPQPGDSRRARIGRPLG
ncbi:MAG: LysM peptidoglycan-binding domain-containing protein [Chloroflexi bacterium]|nr:LysM peptidoglycan-binding domain-containing protein [Chloroflexota bacterium]